MNSPGKAGVREGGSVGNGVPVGVGDFVGVRVGFGVKVSAGVCVLVATGIRVIPIVVLISGVWMEASCSVVEVGSLTVTCGRYRINSAVINTKIKATPKPPNVISCREGRSLSVSADDWSWGEEVMDWEFYIKIVRTLHVNSTPNQANWIPVFQSPVILALMVDKQSNWGN